jgi:EpsI family protein
MPLPGSKTAAILTAVLAVQGLAYYAIAARPELTPAVAPLAGFPTELPGWVMTQDAPVAKEVADVLKASDTMNRVYGNQQGVGVILYIAYWATQRTGATPHSPKNCLPGAGFEPIESPGIQRIAVPGSPNPIEVNRYVVSGLDQKRMQQQEEVVLYWYQSHNRVIASEYSAKFWLILDALRYRRSDTAVVKVVAPAIGTNTAAASAAAVALVQAAYPAILRQLPQ